MLSLGEELKREREFREISLREISDATKINMRMLEAIENDNYRILPGGIFNRNFIRAYAEFIGLDPEIAVRKYQVQTASSVDERLPPNTVPLMPVRESALQSQRGKLIILAILAAFIFGTAFYWLYKTNHLPRALHRTPVKQSDLREFPLTFLAL